LWRLDDNALDGYGPGDGNTDAEWRRSGTADQIADELVNLLDGFPACGPDCLTASLGHDPTPQIQQRSVEGTATQIDANGKPAVGIKLDESWWFAAGGGAAPDLDDKALGQQHACDVGYRRFPQVGGASQVRSTDRAIIEYGLQHQPSIPQSRRLRPGLGVWAQPSGPHHRRPFP
jgi:hypothetical protein